MRVKHRLEKFLLFEYEAVEKHLAKMALDGWQLERVHGILWKYKEAEPKNLTYSVAYIPEADDLNPHKTKGELEFVEYCEAAGWEKVGDWNQMQIFVTERANPVSIDTDEELRLETVHRSMKKQFVPFYVMLTVWLFIRLLVQVESFNYSPIEFMAQEGRVLETLSLGVGVVCAGVISGSYLWWRHCSKKKLVLGEGCVNAEKYGTCIRVSLFLELLSIIGRIQVWFIVLGFVLIAFLTRMVQQLLKKIGVKRLINDLVSVTLMYAMAIGFLYLTYKVPYMKEQAFQNEGRVTAARNEMPFTIEELRGFEETDSEFSMEEKESRWLKWGRYWQYLDYDEENSDTFIYEIVTVKHSGMYGWCKEQYLNVEEGEYQEVLLSENDECEVYRHHNGVKAVRNWVICSKGKIIEINATWELTDEQLVQIIKDFETM